MLTVGASASLRGLVIATFEQFTATDDVWSDYFSAHVIVQHSPPEVPYAEQQIQELRQAYNGTIFQFVSTSIDDQMMQGPYFIQSGRLRQAYLLYPDLYDAFIVSTITKADDPKR